MANILCPTSALTCLPCPEGDPTNPNLSAEKPDLDTFFAIVHYFDTPPLGGSWSEAGCTAVFTSTVSQQDAELQALAAAQECAWTAGGPGGGWRLPPTITNPNGQLRPIFTNSPQSCSLTCPDGSPFTYTVPGGTILAFSQVDADEKAFNLACQQAEINIICFEDLNADGCCQGAFFVFDVFVVTPTDSEPGTFSVAGGTLPTGMTLVPVPGIPTEAFIQGTPTTVGTYVFTIQYELPSGVVGQRTYSVTIRGFTNTSLPQGRFGVTYSATISTFGMTAPVNMILHGSLPSGLSFNASTGAITGTPQVTQTSTFTIEALDSKGNDCNKTFTLKVVDGTFSPLGANWAGLAPPGLPLPPLLTGSCSGTQGSLLTQAVAAGTPNQAWQTSMVMPSNGSTVFQMDMNAVFGAHQLGSEVRFSLFNSATGFYFTLSLINNGSGSHGPVIISWNAGDTIFATFFVQVTAGAGDFPTSASGSFNFNTSN